MSRPNSKANEGIDTRMNEILERVRDGEFVLVYENDLDFETNKSIKDGILLGLIIDLNNDGIIKDSALHLTLSGEGQNQLIDYRDQRKFTSPSTRPDDPQNPMGSPVWGESKASEYTDEEQKILDHTMEAVKMEGFAMDPNAFTTPHTWVQGSAGADDIYCRVCGVSKSMESKASEDWDTDMAEKANKNMKKQFGDFYDPNFNAMDVPPEPKQQSVKDILAGFAEDMEQFDESLASEYSIKEEFDLQDQDGKYEMLSKADLSVTDATNYSTYSHDELPEEVKDSLKGDEDSFGESWSQKSSINRIEALERVGVKQGDAIKLSGLEFEDFGEDLQGELKGDLEDARKDMQQGVKSLNQLGDYNPNDSEDGKKVGLPHQYGEEVENPNSEFGQNYPDYNNIGESQTNMTSYECELCDSGFKSNEALSVHHNDKHAIAPESLDGYATEIGMHGGDGASFYDGKTFTCDKCGKVGNSFSDMAQEECPADVNANHQIPIFGDMKKESYAQEDDLDTLMWDNENPDDKDKQWKHKKGKKQESKASESILAGRSIEEYLQEYGMTRAEGEQVAEYAGMDLKELIEIGNFDEARHHRVQDMDVSYMYEESKANEDFGNAQQKWNSLGWMGRSNVLKKVGLDNISPDTNVWELNSNDWDIISAELIDYDTESKATETEDYWDYRDQGHPPDDWVNWYKCKTCGQSRMDDGTDSMNTVDQHRRDNPTHRIEWTNATEESYSSESDVSFGTLSDYLGIDWKEGGSYCKICGKDLTYAKDIETLNHVNSHDDKTLLEGESKASETNYFHSLDASAEDILNRWLENQNESVTGEELPDHLWNEIEKTDGGSRLDSDDIQNYIDDYFNTDYDGESKASEGLNECTNCDGYGKEECDNCIQSGNSFVVRCPECDGYGKDDNDDTCGECGGDGEVLCDVCDNTGEITCNVCGGDGEVNESKSSEGRYMIRDKDSQWQVQELTDDLELAKAIADDSSTEEISGTQPDGAKGVVVDLDFRQVVYSAEVGSEDRVCAECGFTTSDNSEYLDHLNSHEV